MIGETHCEHEVEYAHCQLVSETVFLRYMNGGYHLHVKDRTFGNITVPLNVYRTKEILEDVNDGTWEYSRCPECRDEP